MSNRYWGWGLEDDEFRHRLVEAGIAIARPDASVVDTGRDRTFKHFHAAAKRQRDYRKCYNQRDMDQRRDRLTGAADVAYAVAAARTVAVGGAAEAEVLDVRLECDRERTPWCDCAGAPATEAPRLPVDPKDNVLPFLPRKQKKKKNR